MCVCVSFVNEEERRWWRQAVVAQLSGRWIDGTKGLSQSGKMPCRLAPLRSKNTVWGATAGVRDSSSSSDSGSPLASMSQVKMRSTGYSPMPGDTPPSTAMMRKGVVVVADSCPFPPDDEDEDDNDEAENEGDDHEQ